MTGSRRYRERRYKHHRDPVTPEVYQQVRNRDHGCVGAIIGLPGSCYGRIELDHVRASGGLGMRSPSTVDNLESLCGQHHQYKTLHG
ncbi:MAG TPA: hypothetical protein VLA89_11550, partial [Gemmatimonadales bacterium]|nr:hypothetical protein [Gemmatimonadales bacterium]